MPITKDSKKVSLSRSDNGSSAEIYLYGASVTSWKAPSPASKDVSERLFLSDLAVLDGSKAIRGGVPVCWPTFGPPPSDEKAFPHHSKLPQHGFARITNWTVGKEQDGASPSVEFVLEQKDVKEDFPYPFHLSYTVTLNEFSLDLTFKVKNTSDKETLKFQNLMHTYYQIPSHLTCSVSSLKGASYVDKTKDAQVFTEDREATVTDGVETDRVYQDIGPRTLTLDYGGEKKGQGVKVEFKGYKDCTVWNPAEEKAKATADMQDDGYKTFIAIEPGYVKEFKELAAGEEWEASVSQSTF